MQFSSLSFKRYSVDFGQTKNQREKSEGVREKSLSELLNADKDPSLTPAQSNRYRVEGNKRLLNPFYNLIFALLGCTGLLIGNFNRRGQTKIISFSILAMILIQTSQLTLENLAVKHINLLFMLYVNLLVPLIICIYLLLFYNPAVFHRPRSSGEQLYEQ